MVTNFIQVWEGTPETSTPSLFLGADVFCKGALDPATVPGAM